MLKMFYLIAEILDLARKQSKTRINSQEKLVVRMQACVLFALCLLSVSMFRSIDFFHAYQRAISLNKKGKMLRSCVLLMKRLISRAFILHALITCDQDAGNSNHGGLRCGSSCPSAMTGVLHTS